MKQTRNQLQGSLKLSIEPSLAELAKKSLFPKKVKAAIVTLSKVKLPAELQGR